MEDTACTMKYMNGIKDRATLFGPISFDSFGDVSYGFFLKTVRNGEFVRVK